MAGSSERTIPRTAVAMTVALAAAALLWAFPLFRIVPLKSATANLAGSAAAGTFDAAAMAAKLWSGDLREAARRAADATVVVNAIRGDPAAARRKHARSVGMGAAYFFVRGSGKVITRDRTTIRLVLDGPETSLVALRIGPIFGNAVRDGCGLLDVNQVPGLHEFNALSAELNKLVESQVLPGLREKADVGSTVTFAGCAEAPESATPAGEPVLVLVPLMAEVRG